MTSTWITKLSRRRDRNVREKRACAGKSVRDGFKDRGVEEPWEREAESAR